MNVDAEGIDQEVEAFRYSHPRNTDEEVKVVLTQNVEPVIEEKIVLHRLPYMKMDLKITKYVNGFMFSCMFALSI